jgi:hypothetical protein
MAKTLRNPQSGKHGTSVSYKTPYGEAERPLTVPKNPNTTAQIGARSALGRTAARWRKLTEEQRVTWITAAHQTSSYPSLGQSGPLTGCQLFIKINCTLAAIGQAPVDLPPERPSFSANPVGALSITGAGDAVTLKLTVPRSPACYIMLWGTAPCSVGISRPRRFTLLGALPAPVWGVSDITALYVAKYGVPSADSRIFIRTQQSVGGWTDIPRDTTAIVPAA